ncbi:MAG: hypothetical protein CMP28_05895 [Roseibacillus sp.]|nr:hypothetical protein [Roseibacillus sp.]
MKSLALSLTASLCLPLAAQTKQGEDPGEQAPRPSSPLTKEIPREKTNPEKASRALERAQRLQAEKLSAREARLAEARRKARAKAEAIKKGTLDVAKLVVPSESAPDKELPGTWILESESLGRSLTEQFQKAAGRGMAFTLDKLTGDYLAEINSDKSKIIVHWKDWKMESVAKRDDFKVALAVSVTGKQEYTIVKLTSGKAPESRKILLELSKDETKSQSFFQGARIRSKVDLPALASGHWSINEGILHLQGIKQKVPWKFKRATKEQEP